MRNALLFALALLSLPLHAFELKPFNASYTADWKTVPVTGSAERQLEKIQDGVWKLSFDASLMIVSLTEHSLFRTDTDTLQPLQYRFERSGLTKSKQVSQDFDWQNKTISGSDNGDPVSLPLNTGILDKASYQVALQRDVMAGKKSVSYQVVDGEEIETYDFRVLGNETVQTGAGRFDALKVERVRDPTKSRRQTVMWLAREWNGLLVQLYQMEKDGKEYYITLKEGTVDGKAVKGQ